MPYLRGEAPASPEGCLFCRLPEEEDAAALIVHRGAHAYVVLNRYPYNNGHLMVVPYAHVGSLEELDAPAAGDLLALAQLSLQVLREAYRPQGFNLGMNIGEVAGAGVAGHIHLHIVPRWGGDTNYMTVACGTRVVAEWLEETYQRLRPLFARLSGGR